MGLPTYLGIHCLTLSSTMLCFWFPYSLAGQVRLCTSLSASSTTCLLTYILHSTAALLDRGSTESRISPTHTHWEHTGCRANAGQLDMEACCIRVMYWLDWAGRPSAARRRVIRRAVDSSRRLDGAASHHGRMCMCATISYVQ